MLHFLEIKSQFESLLSDNELLELRYVPCAFGGGLVAYRIKGKIVKLNFDGKDEWITIYMTPKNSKYPTANDYEISSNTFKVLIVKINFVLEKIGRV